MKKYISLMLGVLLTAGLASCSKENPFGGEDSEAMGKVLKSALSVELKNTEGIAAGTRAATPNANDFTVDFIADGNETPYVSYLYSEMPEVVDLPAGAFTAVAHYGDNKTAAWEEPYFKGETKFIVVADQITEVADPIVASLSNVRVSIIFDPSLKAVMSSDSKVNVKVGDEGSLDFTDADADRSGYFAYVDDSMSLTATFRGVVEGVEVVENKGYDNVAPGNHYRTTFKMHSFDTGDPGDINGNVVVDAEVEVVDMNVDLDPEDKPIIDDMRPVEGEPENPDPENPDTPNPPAANAPKAEVVAAPDGKVAIDLNAVNEITDNLYCAWKVVSAAPGGFTTFKVDIISDTLTPSELEGVNLTDKLDLIDPGQYEAALAGLGFPVKIGGQSEAEFNISDFLPLLSGLGEGNHEFKLTVSDANGTSVISIKLHSN